MADTRYSQGVSQTTPEISAPHDYQNINASAESFGGAIGRGMEQAGPGIERAAEFYKKASIDDVFNNAAKQMNYVSYGDPNSKIANADGVLQADTGFMGKHGADAMNSRQNAEKQIEDIIQNSKQQLKTPDQQQAFESQIRRLQNQHIQQIGSHTTQQADSWYGSVNKSSADLAMQDISRNANDQYKFHDNLLSLQKAYRSQVALEGGGPVQFQDADRRALRDGTRARIEAVAPNDPQRAYDMVEKNKETLGTLYEPLAMQMKNRADTAFGDKSALEKMGQAKSNMPLTDPGHPVFTQIANSNQGGFSSGGLARLVQIESRGKANAVSPGGGYTGLTQMGEAEFKRYGPPGGSRDNPQDSLYAANNYAKSNGIILAHNIGKPPTDADLYLAHQQGAAGASKLLLNPDIAPKDLYITENGKQVSLSSHVASNGGDPNAPARDFTNMWANKFNQIQGTNTAQTAGIPTLGQSQVSGSPTINAPSTTPTPQAVNQGLDFMRQHAMQSTMDDLRSGKITQDQANHTFNAIDRDYRVQKVAEDSNDKMKKALENKAASDLYLKMLDPGKNGNIIEEIRTNKDLGDNWQLRHQLEHLALHPDDNNTTASPQYLQTLDKVTRGDIDSMSQLYRMQIDGKLKQRDVDELSKAVMHMQTDPTERELQAKKKDVLKSIETKVAYFGLQQRPFASEEGKAYFDSKVVNSFETQFKQFRQTEEGRKDPYKFFEEKNVQKFIQSAPSQAELGVSALKDSTGKTVAPVQAPKEIPSMPEEMKELGVTDSGWRQVMNSSPTIKGQHIDGWDKVVSKVLQNQSNPKSIQAFNELMVESGFKNAIKAEDIIKTAKGKSEDQQALDRLKKIMPEEKARAILNNPLEKLARGADAALF